MYDQAVAEQYLQSIKMFSATHRQAIKPILISLAKIYEEGIIDKNPYLLSKIKSTLATSEEISTQDIANFINKLKKKHFNNVSTSWIYEILPEKYKKKVNYQHLISSDDINQASLYSMLPEIKERIKKMERGEDYKSRDIKIKEKTEELENYDWKCYIAQELAKLSIKLEKNHDKHDASLCAKFAKRVKTARDARFATDLQSYEAIVVACGSFKSLNNVAEGEWEFKEFWTIYDDMKNCKECLSLEDCAAHKCKHICHKVVKPMTTKGLKYAIKTNEWLSDLDKQMKNIMKYDNDLCAIAKILFENPKTNKYLNTHDKKDILARHIKNTDCFQCQDFLEGKPDFFAND